MSHSCSFSHYFFLQIKSLDQLSVISLNCTENADVTVSISSVQSKKERKGLHDKKKMTINVMFVLTFGATSDLGP